MSVKTSSHLPRGDGLDRLSHEPLATAQWIPQERLARSLCFDEKATANISPFIFGKTENPDDETAPPLLLSYEDDSHLATFAGSRAGKGVSLVIPNLLAYQGSIICIDLKGENAAITADYRRNVLGQEVIVLDPFNVTEFETASLNPLSFIETDSKVLIDDINDIAEALIVRGDAKSAHWDDSAKSVIKMILLFIVLEHEEKHKNLVCLREYLLTGIPLENDADDTQSDGESSFTNFLLFLSYYEHAFIAGMAKRLLDMGDSERGSVMSTVHRNTEFLDSLSIHDVIGTSDLDLSQLRSKKGASIYLVMPEKRLAQQSRWLRLLITVFLQYLQTDIKTTHQDPSVLLVLDESASLGHMQVIERAMGYIAGFGVKLWVIFQDLNQLKDIYAKRWETFLGNAGILTAFGNIDLTTQDYLSRRLGKCETHRIEYNYSGGTSKSENTSSLLKRMEQPDLLFGEGGSEGETSSWNAQPRDTVNPLLLPDEIGREFGKNSGNILVLIGGAQPIWAKRIYYYQDMPFKDRAAENPYYRT